MTPGEAARHVLDTLEGGASIVEVVLIESAVEGCEIGSRMVVWEDRVEGSLGHDTVDAAAIAVAREALRSREAGLHSSEGVKVFIDPHFPPDELVIVGAGHIARPLSRIGAMLGYQVTILDDRPGFATRERFPDADRLLKADFSDPFREVRLGPGTHLVLVTRGHKYDYEALRDVLRRGVKLGYVGMVGSQRRVRAAMEQLVREGIPRAALESVYAPIGLDIGGETPEEIALSIASELIRLRRGGTGQSLRDKARVLERWLRDDSGPVTPPET